MSQTKRPFFLTEKGYNKVGSESYINRHIALDNNSTQLGLTYEKDGENNITLVVHIFSKQDQTSYFNLIYQYFNLMYQNENGTLSKSMIALAVLTLGIGALVQAIYYGAGKMDALKSVRSVMTRALEKGDAGYDADGIAGLLNQTSSFFQDTFDSIMGQDILRDYFKNPLNNKVPSTIKIQVRNETKFVIELGVQAMQKKATVKIFNSDSSGHKLGEAVHAVEYTFDGSTEFRLEEAVVSAEHKPAS